MPTERATVSDAEAETVGLAFGAYPNAWADRITPLLRAKGIPEQKLIPGYVPFRMTRADGGFIFEFGDSADHIPEVDRMSA